VDRGSDGSASAVSAGVLNPVAGRRLTKVWRVEELLPAALAFYREIEEQLGETLVRPLHGWRLFRDRREAEHFRANRGQGELAPFDQGELAPAEIAPWVDSAHGGIRVSEVHRLDVSRLLAVSRQRWITERRLVETDFRLDELEPGALGPVWRGQRFGCVILCTGAELRAHRFLHGRLNPAVGELAEMSVPTWPEDVVIHAGIWFAPLARELVIAGGSYRPDGSGRAEEGAREIETIARTTLRMAWGIRALRSGVRLAAPDRCPLAGWLESAGRIGVSGALGSKASLWSPWLARQWVAHLRHGAAFDPTVNPARLLPAG
jgi:hypothetical protein